ncbi:protein nessun dorma isoform X2 [Topomyia yanbarensis]|uniref:protein nessun dorma isoform X2 n=1 Tax=Topomyia yanbarensis TaxID=2498891 RepID=UPI00273B9498|nr:protein nessun dorma isoform X2 [Topomyia yanbarensis]
MEVYEFEKSLLTRLQEAHDILSARGIPIVASAVRNEWANYIEIAIEPTGWQSLWRIPRVVCEELSVKYPTVVMGTVEQVLFDELKAIFLIEAVQDDVHLPDKQIVSLEELWPLKEQENNALNVDRTANCLDQLRFFYQHIWMPWDNDDDDERNDWAEKHLEGRIKFYYDLKNKSMSKRLSSHIMALLAEANYIQKKREMLDAEEEENKNQSDDEDLLRQNKASDLMEIYLRLNYIKNEVEILENPAMREIYEKVRFSDEISYFERSNVHNEASADVFVVTHIGTVDQQIEYLTKAKLTIDENKVVRICDSLQGALERCKPSDKLYLPPGRHLIKFLEYLNNGGAIRAISPVRFVEIFESKKMESVEEKAIMSSKDDNSVLITVDGDYCFENVMLDCINVRTGVLVKRGNVTFKNCYFMGDANSTTKQGIVVFGNSSIRFDDCVIKDFSVGIYSNHNCRILLSNSIIHNCINGIEVLHGCTVSFLSSKINQCKDYGVSLEVDDLQTFSTGETCCTYSDYNQIERPEFKFEGSCLFSGNGRSNFVIFKSNNGEFNNSCFVEEQRQEKCRDSLNPAMVANKRKSMEE